MRKIEIYSLFMFINLLVFSETISLEKILYLAKDKGDISKINRIEQKKITIEKVDFNLEKLFGLKFELGDQYSLSYANNGDSSNKLNSSLEYKNLSLNYNFEYTEYGLEILKTNVMYNKVLNDFIYSEQEYNEKTLKIREQKIKLENKERICKELENIIEIYKEIKNLENTIELKQFNISMQEEKIRIIKDKFSTGEGTKNEIQMNELNKKMMNEELQLDISNLKNMKQDLFNKINEDYKENYEFEKIDDEAIGVLYLPDFEIKKKNLEVDSTMQEIKKASRNESSTISFNGKYEFSNEQWDVGLILKSNLLNYKGQKNIMQEQLKKVKDELVVLMDNYNISMDKELANKKLIEAKYEISKDKLNINKPKFDKIEELFINGYFGKMDYLNYKKDYLEFLLSEKNAKNDLNALGWKNKIRKTIMED